MYTFKEIHSW